MEQGILVMAQCQSIASGNDVYLLFSRHGWMKATPRYRLPNIEQVPALEYNI